MADIRRRIRRIQQRNAGNIHVRVFRDRLTPLEVYSEDEIFSRYRFRPHSIEILVRLVSGDLARDTRRSQPLPPLLCVLVTLQFLATGAHYVVIGDVHGLSASSVCRAVRQVVRFFARLGQQRTAMRADSQRCKSEFYTIADKMMSF